MGKEIERKFLVEGEAWRYDENGKPLAGTLYRQGYLNADKDRTVRLRLAGEKGFITIKGLTAGYTRSEFEYEIPQEDCREMLDTLAVRPLIEKTRYRVAFGGNIWEIDEFSGENRGLILAEIELAGEGQEFVKPAWAGREVTGDPRYFNSNLAFVPYRAWADSL